MKGYLLLANGQLYEGTLMGAAKPVMAELVFTTAMTGYLDSGGLRVAAPAPVRVYRP